MTNKLQLKDLLAAFDLNAKSAWNELTDDEKKQVGFWILTRYMSSISGKRESQELAVFKTNEYYNKNWNVLGTKHPQLQWQLLCLSGNSGKIERHEWLGLKSKSGKNKATNLLEKIYPAMKLDEVEVLARILTKDELKELAEQHGIETKDS